jgi:hypothetical protein
MESIYSLLKFVMGAVVVGIVVNFVGNYWAAKKIEAGKKLHDLEVAMARVEEIVKNNATQAGVTQLRADLQKDFYAEIQGNDSKLRDFVQLTLNKQTTEVKAEIKELPGETQKLIERHKELCDLKNHRRAA